jgi:phosphogluconate dehydratase
MSGASGPVPAAIHLTPEAARGGPIGRIRDGDVIRLDVEARTLNVLADLKDFESRDVVSSGLPSPPGYGLELFRTLRATIKSAEEGALSCL